MHVARVTENYTLNASFFLPHSLSECYLTCRLWSQRFRSQDLERYDDDWECTNLHSLPGFFLCVFTQLFFFSFISQLYSFMHAIFFLLSLLNFLSLFLIYLCQNKWFVLFSSFFQLIAFVVCWSFGFVFFIAWTLPLQKLASFSLAVKELSCRNEFANYLH